jgi:hypothetical protein
MDPQTIDPGIPDWVMLGVPGPVDPAVGAEEGVWLYASKDLTAAQLKAEVDEEAERDWMEQAIEPGFLLGALPPPPRPIITITATLKSFVVVQAPDYPTAFEALFKRWRPEAAARAALPEGARKLEER